MSSIKEPYIISVWEEELIPAQDWYIEGDKITAAQYEALDDEKKKEYRPHTTMESFYIKERKRLSNKEFQSLFEDLKNSYVLMADGSYKKGEEIISKGEYLSILQQFTDKYEKYPVIEHYEETQGVIIGTNDMDSACGVINPIFKENINGSVELIFSLYYKVFDPELNSFTMNPFVSMLTNESKIKLKFREKWYDLIIKNCVEDSVNYMFTYTCKDFYINELSKNGFKVELDAVLENNQNTVAGLGKTILNGTDWYIDKEKTDILVETKVEPLYIGSLAYDIVVEKVNDYVPDVMVKGSEYPDTFVIPRMYIVEVPKENEGENQQQATETATMNTNILLFYSDFAERRTEPQILAVFSGPKNNATYEIPVEDGQSHKYLLDTNEDVITNGCNYRIIGYKKPGDDNVYKIEYASSGLNDNILNIIDLGGLSIYQRARAEKVIRSQETGYDPDMDKLISKYYKIVYNPQTKEKEIDKEVKYYGYQEEEILRTDLTENILANSDNFISTETGWVFDGVPEKRTQNKETGYSGQIFQRSSLDEYNSDSGSLHDESVLEMNLKSKDDYHYYLDNQGEYYLIKTEVNSEGEIIKQGYEEVNSEKAKNYINRVFELYKKYQREGVEGYADKTDAELKTMLNEYLNTIRYSKKSHVAINTGVAANRNKIKHLTPGEEYVFAVSLGKFREGDTPFTLPKYNRQAENEILYGIKPPTDFYQFIEVDNYPKFTYDATIDSIKEYQDDLNKGVMKYYMENTTYAGEYQAKYEQTYNVLQEDYKKRYLRTSFLSNDRTLENWQPGGRQKHIVGIFGEWIGYYEIFLNVLRGFGEGEGESEETYRYPSFLEDLHQALSRIDSSKNISKQLYEAFISGYTEEPDRHGKIQTYYYGLYPTMVRQTMTYANDRKKEVSLLRRSAYDVMGYDEEKYPDYDEDTFSLTPIMNSFNEFLFSEFYYDILKKWTSEKDGAMIWTYQNTKEYKQALSSLLKTTYKACYENTNQIWESAEHAKGYHMPSTLEPKGGKYYQIHQASWVKKSTKAAEDHVLYLESQLGDFKPPFTENDEDKKNDFIQLFSGAYKVDEKKYEKDSDNLVDFCYKKEQDWLTTKTDAQLQENDIIKELKQKRVDWIKEYFEYVTKKYNGQIEISRYGGAWYCANLLGKFYSHWDDEKEISTYTYNNDTYSLNFTVNNSSEGADGALHTEVDELKPLAANPYVDWKRTIYYTKEEGAEYFALLDETKEEENKKGGYVFDRESKQIRLFDPYLDVLNATFIPQKDDEGAYVFDPFTWQYRPYRDWDSKEYRDPLTLELDNNTGVPGDKAYHPLKLFDGHLGAWYDIPTRYNMIRKYEDPNDESKYKYLSEKRTITEVGHYDGEEYEYEITYPIGYQYDVYVPTKRGKYIKESEVNTRRLFDLNGDGTIGITFSFNKQTFINFFNEQARKIEDFFEKIEQKFKTAFNINSKDDLNEDMVELQDAYSKNDDEADKMNAGLANSNANSSEMYDEDRASIKVCYGEEQDTGDTDSHDEKITISWGLGAPILDEISNASEFANAIKNGIAKLVDKTKIKTKARDISDEEKIITTRYIKYKPYYWRHWGRQRYDYQPKICIQRTVDGIKYYKPYNNVEDKKSEAYYVHKIERDNDGNPTNIPANATADKLIFLKDRITSYRQRTETDYEAYKYRMKKTDSLNKNYWIEDPNGENYLRKYKFGDGETKLFDGHLGRWVQCYSAFKVTKTSGDPYYEEGENVDDYLDKFYMPYDDIMIPYNNRVFGATKQLTRVRTKYDGTNASEVYIYHNGIYMTLESYLLTVGYTFPLDYSNLKISFIDQYDYSSDTFAISTEQSEKYLEFDLSNEEFYNSVRYADLVVTENTLTEEVVKERWAYWVAPVTKAFSLTENLLSKIGILFETTAVSPDDSSDIKSNEYGRYVFLGMQMFKYIPYETSLDKITTQIIDEEEKEEVINEALKEIYTVGDNEPPLYTTESFIQKLQASRDSISLLNTANALHSKNMTVLMNLISNQDENGNQTEEVAGLDVVQVTEEQKVIVPLFPGQAPDAAELHFTNYYIYDPDIVNHPDSAIYEYVGQDYSELFVPAYDDSCEKIRSIKGKESNYFKLLQDCCDTFDCWMKKDICHNETTGQIIYHDIPVFTEILNSNEDNNAEPQIFVGEEAKEAGTKDAAKGIHHKLYGKIQIALNENETLPDYIVDDRLFYQYYTYKEIEKDSLDEKEQKLLLRLNRLNNLTFTTEYMRVPDKRIYFKRYVGEEKWNGFKYGVNLKHIKRTIDSNQFSTRIIVKTNNNEFGKDKCCTISRASENPTKENFILDFSYYVNNKLLDNSDLIGDLYTNTNTRLNYYPKLASLNREIESLITKQSSLLISLDNINSKYDTAVLLRDSSMEEITKLAQIFTQSYDTYGQIITVPWEYGKSQEYEQKRQTSTPGTTKSISEVIGEDTINFVIEIPPITTVAEYPKYNDTMRTYLDQMDVYQKEYLNSLKTIEKLEPEKRHIEAELAEIDAHLEEIKNKKEELNKLFYYKYSRFIQEGAWIDESYMDDNLYYLDALSVSRTSSKPKVTYDIGVVDLAAAYEYEEDRILLESELGDRTYIEDTEFFGYRKNDHTRPYWELVIVTEKTYNLTDPSQNQIKVRNYSTQFEDIFQRVAAASQTLQFNEGSYSRISSLLNDDGTLKSEVLGESIMNTDFILMNSTNENVKTDKTGITITSTENRSNVIRIVSAGILVSNDGGNRYSTAITGDGINADLLVSGTLNTDKLLIGGRSNPNFLWNRMGISSFRTDGEKIDYSSFVRMDQYGIYGIQYYSKNEREPQNMSINDCFEPTSLKDITDNPKAVFGLTWDGFFLNAVNGTGKVTIGTGQDFRMSEYSDKQTRWVDRVIIGRLNENDYYGFQLKNSTGQVVMETGDSGELYLKRKLRISNFGDEDTIQPHGWVQNGSEEEIVEVNVKVQVQEKNIEGNLVYDIYGKPVIIEGDGKYYPFYTIKKAGETIGDIEFTEDTVYYEQKTSFNSYFYKYEATVDENNQRINVKNYYSIEDRALFRTEPASEKWEDNIKKQLDRVSLGIVDTYSRKQNLQKVNLDGKYSSSEYLTKVFSVKSNVLLPLEQFTDDDIKNIIEENENFAIFDNGNLFAKNAWIEGNINATSGRITNCILDDLDIYGTLQVGKKNSEESTLGTIKQVDDEWKICGDGTAYFKNIVISGKIQTAIFEQEKVQTVAGTLLIASEIPIKEGGITKESNTAKCIRIYLESNFPKSKVIQDFSDGGTATIASSAETKKAKVMVLDSMSITEAYATDADVTFDICGYGSANFGGQEEVPYIEIETEKTINDFQLKKYVLFLGFEEDDEVLGISINASGNSSYYPQDSISIVNINDPAQPPKSLFGLFTSKLFEDSNNYFLTSDMVNKYGLYSDNVYIKGAMVSETKDFIAGITTTEKLTITPHGKERPEHVVFFAGTRITDNATENEAALKFYVTREGSLYASEGYFNGTIQTSKIIGNGEGDYALEIVGSTKNALRFLGNYESVEKEFLSFTDEGSYFYHNIDKGQLVSFIHDQYAVGMFGLKGENKNDINNYKLNFVEMQDEKNKEKEWVEIRCKGESVAKISTEGFKVLNAHDLGENCESVAVYSDQKFIGIDFKLSNIQ